MGADDVEDGADDFGVLGAGDVLKEGAAGGAGEEGGDGGLVGGGIGGGGAVGAGEGVDAVLF